MNHTSAVRTVLQCRTDLYDACYQRADALFELMDALLAMGSVPSPAHLSLAAPHRRGWGSLYAALRKGRIDRDLLLTRLAHLPLEAGEPIYAVDCSTWARCGDQPRTWLLLPSQPAFCGSAPCRRVVVAVDQSAQFCAG